MHRHYLVGRTNLKMFVEEIEAGISISAVVIDRFLGGRGFGKVALFFESLQTLNCPV